MSHTLPAGLPMREIVSTCWSPYGLGPLADFFEAGDGGGTAAWPSANRSILVPITLTSEYVVRKLWVRNGTVASGNFSLGVYDANGAALLVSTGSTAMSGTSVYQAVDVTDTYLGAGQYYMAMSQSGTTGSYLRLSLGTVPNLKHYGVLQAASNHPVAANPTLAVVANAYVPMCGMSSRSDLPA